MKACGGIGYYHDPQEYAHKQLQKLIRKLTLHYYHGNDTLYLLLVLGYTSKK
jgi:hypothetical protein